MTVCFLTNQYVKDELHNYCLSLALFTLHYSTTYRYPGYIPPEDHWAERLATLQRNREPDKRYTALLRI